MQIVTIILEIILGIGYVIVGFMKFGAKEPVESFKQYGYSVGFRILVGIAEILGGIGMLIGIWSKLAGSLAGLWIVVIMLGALVTQIRAKSHANEVMLPVYFLVLALVVPVLNWIV
ncbi:DoxX family protein [Bacillus sp. BRMEA1]|uniref:DoxX family protein n=1 Tax=Neobacillus endophyticus TaxID=2738405 RepID=UPI0015645FF1|nr:DoxX family protein [Neobacillus endophyticus]NRD78507.1 DoxX family protein [Neobacillus endophyticus]